MSRIELTDNVMDIMVKMADGNPGAINALMNIMQESEAIDPQSAFGPLSVIIGLDSNGIYGTDIYVLYNDKCNKDVRMVCVIMRAVQLGIMSSAKLKEMAADQCRKVDLSADEWDRIDNEVCGQLVEFKKKVA